MIGLFIQIFVINFVGMCLDWKNFGIMPVVYSLFHAFLFCPCALFTFYKGYRCLCGIDDAKFYRVAEILMIGFSGTICVLGFFCYHGFLFMIKLFASKGSGWFMGILVLIESCYVVVMVLLRLLCLFKVRVSNEGETLTA